MSYRGGAQGTSRLYPVVLNVYDLSPVNDYISWLGIGLYHSGLEVAGREWTFGSGSGVFECQPREVPGFRRAVPLGELDVTSMHIETVAWDLARDYPGTRYHLLSCNCNHFAAELALRLGAAPVPGWVNRLAAIGACFAWLLPASLTGVAPVSDGQPASMQVKPKPAAFSGAGRSLLSDDASESTPLLPRRTTGGAASDSREAMRERAMQAAMAREQRMKEQQE
uniref:PPPDE domain-containing protein n=1 Tax=Calcidiscus leptoporus TaxID=127549 RepID=A0A7S0NZZ1_9EUKA